jgi:hypothetical protein
MLSGRFCVHLNAELAAFPLPGKSVFFDVSSRHERLVADVQAVFPST